MADIVMTGQAGANRTFRSIFGDQDKRHDDVLFLELEQSSSSRSRSSSSSSTSIAADSGAGIAICNHNDDDDEDSMWNDEPLLEEEEESAKDDEGNTSFPGLHFAQRKSMEEWADDDDEEENWKEALQDRVNQLELAFQHNDDATAAQSRRQFEQQQVKQFSAQESQGADFGQSLPVPSRFDAPDGDPDRPRQASRHKMQRTSSLHACITGNNADASHCQNQHWDFQRKVAGETVATVLNQNRRMRSTSIDFVACNIQTAEHHCNRSGSLGGSGSSTEMPRYSQARKNVLDNSQSSLSTSSHLRGTNAVPPEDATFSLSSSTAVLNLSATEAIRRFVLEDAKNMSMERLVSDAQRLHFLENFYQNRQGLRYTPSITSSTAVSPPSLASSP